MAADGRRRTAPVAGGPGGCSPPFAAYQTARCGPTDRVPVPPELLGVRGGGHRAPRRRAAEAGWRSSGSARCHPWGGHGVDPVPDRRAPCSASLTTPIGKIFQPLLDFVGSVLAFFYSIIPNYPIDVALLTIVIMAALTPLTVKSTKNMAAMQALGPEMKKLQQKYKGAENRAQMNEEMMKLYKEHNVNPASGCLPMLLQMPFSLFSTASFGESPTR